MNQRDAIMERIEALEAYIDAYDTRGKTFGQFWADVQPHLDDILPVVEALGDDEVVQRLNFALAAADQRGLYESPGNLDRLISDGPSPREGSSGE